MNQILSTGDNYGNDASSANNVTKIFCIIIIIFALALSGIGMYTLIKNKDNKKYSGPIPDVKIEINEDEATIKVVSEVGVNKIIYKWDDGEESIIEKENKKQTEETIVIPNGECTLNIKVVESNKRESKFKQEISYDSNIEEKDTKEPEIKISGENKKVSIVATDNKEMYALAYKWNDENPILVKAEGEDKTVIKVDVEAKKGKNTITVIAKDKEGNIANAKEEIIAASKPKIAVTKTNDKINIKVTDEDEIVKVQYQINNQIRTKEITGNNKKELTITESLQEGENKIAIIVENKSGLKQTYVGKCTYNP